MLNIFRNATLYCSAVIAIHVFSGSFKGTGNIFIDILLCVIFGAFLALAVTPIAWLVLRVQGKDPSTYQSGSR